jgi:hypothetical protein
MPRVGWGSSVGIATLYWLDGPGIESRWGGADLTHSFKQVVVSSQPPIKWVSPPSPRLSGRSVSLADHPIELHLYFPSGPSWPIVGRPLPFTICRVHAVSKHEV